MFSQASVILFTGGEHAWQRVCVVGVCVAGGMDGNGHAWWRAWQGGHMAEGACVAGGVHGRRRDGHCSGRYALHWYAFLFIDLIDFTGSPTQGF